MGRFEHKLPAVLNPLGEICVEVTIPAHPDYIALFIRAVRMLETNRLYERDEALSAKIVVDQWRQRTITPLIEALATGTGVCGNLDGECLAYPPFASFIAYTPQNPYTQPDLVPEGFEQPPFYVNGKDGSHDLPNYNKGDVLVDFGSISLELGFELENAPTIDLCLEGSGVAELHLLAIVQGGVVVISLDNPIDVGDILAGIIGDSLLIVDLNQDIVSLPPETAIEIIQEIDVPTEGEHHLYIVFLPIIDDSLIPLRFGGGLREVSLCGNLRPCGMPPPEPPPPLEGVTELRPEFQFTSECGMEYRLRDQENNIVQDWTPVAGWVDNAAACFTPEGGGMSLTKDEVRDAIVEAEEIKASRFLAGVSGNVEGGVTINPDGSITISTGGIPSDDPETAYDDAKAAVMGGTLAVAAALNAFFDDLDTYYGTTNGAPATPEATAKFNIKLYYPCDDSVMDTAIALYYTYRGSNPRILFDNTSAVSLYLYCHGADERGFSQWIIDASGYALDKQNVVHNLATGLAQEFWDSYFEKGVAVPSTAFLDAPCVPIPLQVLEALLFSVARNTTPFKANHMMEFTSEGYALDVDGDIQDTHWYRTAAGVNTFQQWSYTHSSGTNQPSQNQVPYRSDHKYQWTIQLGNLNAAMVITPTKHASMNAAGLTYPVPFKLTIRDLGEVTL